LRTSPKAFSGSYFSRRFAASQFASLISLLRFAYQLASLRLSACFASFNAPRALLSEKSASRRANALFSGSAPRKVLSRTLTALRGNKKQAMEKGRRAWKAKSLQRGDSGRFRAGFFGRKALLWGFGFCGKFGRFGRTWRERRR
jgi:hypothetical protein